MSLKALIVQLLWCMINQKGLWLTPTIPASAWGRCPAGTALPVASAAAKLTKAWLGVFPAWAEDLLTGWRIEIRHDDIGHDLFFKENTVSTSFIRAKSTEQVNFNFVVPL